MTDKTMRDIQSEIARIIPEPRNLVTRLEYARRVLAIPEIKEGLELREEAESGKLVELVEVQDDGSCYTVGDAMDSHEALVKPLASGESR